MAGLLSKVTTSAQALPSRVFLYAREKWGKSSLFAHAPDAIFFMTRGETGLVELISGGRVPPTAHFDYDEQAPPTWSTLRQAIRELQNEDHKYRFLVIDTCNGAEILCQEHVRSGKPFNGNVHAFNAYGKGMEACRVEWLGLLQDLDALRAKRKMTIVLLAHTSVKKFDDPTLDESYDKYRPACAEKLWDLTHKWSDIICFGHFESRTYETDSGKVKAKNEVNRVLCFDQSPAYEAGNRYGIIGKVDCSDGAKNAFGQFAALVRDAKSGATKQPPKQVDVTAPPAQPPAPEGQQRPDPSPGTAPPASARSADSAPVPTGAATGPETAGTETAKTMPAAEQRTDAPTGPRPGAEFVVWADTKDAALVAAGLRKKGGVRRWLKLVQDRRKLPDDIAKWGEVHVRDSVVIIDVFELLLRTGRPWGDACLPWLNETRLRTYPQHTAVEAVMPMDLLFLAAALRDNPAGVVAPSEELAGAAS